ncbi:MAG TPA: biotin/lipoyl-binding protein, partial [Gemmatimonadaceae bacterium]|nr:biotin/lipoyl-binding protein [Gemmatimonadaceae bacterium]
MRRTMQGRRRAVAVVSLLAVALTTACHKPGGDEGDEVQAVVAANTDVVHPQAFTETMGALGIVAPRAGHQATLSAPAAGRVAQVYVTTGQRVRPGQRLVELDQAPFRSAAQAADAALTAAEQAAERQRRLADEGIVPRKDAEAATAEVAKARAEAADAHRAERL